MYIWTHTHTHTHTLLYYIYIYIWTIPSNLLDNILLLQILTHIHANCSNHTVWPLNPFPILIINYHYQKRAAILESHKLLHQLQWLAIHPLASLYNTESMLDVPIKTNNRRPISQEPCEYESNYWSETLSEYVNSITLRAHAPFHATNPWPPSGSFIILSAGKHSTATYRALSSINKFIWLHFSTQMLI